MPETPWDISHTAAIIFIAGFAIQQTLEIISPFFDKYFIRWYGSFFNILPVDNPSDDDLKNCKKALMPFLSFLLGLLVVLTSGISILGFLDPKLKGVVDLLISGLVVGSGTAAADTFLKYTGFLKEKSENRCLFK